MKSKNCLIIFTRKPELGKVKTRLAKDIGDEDALKVYNHLLAYSSEVCKSVIADKHVWYTSEVQQDDVWDNSIFSKYLQPEGDLGDKMKYAFNHAFELNYRNVIIIGTDLPDINSALIEEAFELLKNNDVVLGPATDGGYYLLGLTEMIDSVFTNKQWGSDQVFKQTLENIKTKNLSLLEYKNNIDYIEYLEVMIVPRKGKGRYSLKISKFFPL